jgi:hypothetical protein
MIFKQQFSWSVFSQVHYSKHHVPFYLQSWTFDTGMVKTFLVTRHIVNLFALIRTCAADVQAQQDGVFVIRLSDYFYPSRLLEAVKRTVVGRCEWTQWKKDEYGILRKQMNIKNQKETVGEIFCPE